ncbi:MAG: tRNA (guanosine(37)-N1)-methyltransferase TrmD, partial [Syntrophales bacterium]|nr:tRNA (guanosine(37)-N1)-methyltransferase TrmD [Syntrophales bacterium]
MGLRFDILTIFPELFGSALDCGILKKARERGIVEIFVHDIRAFATDRHRTTDDYPYGGGGGMVMKVEPIDRAVASLAVAPGTPIVLLTPQGETFRQETAQELAACGRIVLICGRYEGVDERVRRHIVNRELSIGDYVLSGGEPAALVIVDAVARLVPGVVGNAESV